MSVSRFAGYYKVDVGLPDAPAGMRIMAVTDINNDKLNDLVTVDNTAQTVTVYYYDDVVQKYTRESSYDFKDGWSIDSVIPSPTTSGLQDLICVVSKHDGGELQTKLQYVAQRDSGGSGMAASQYTWELDPKNDLNDLKIFPGTQPMTLDVDGD